MRALHNRHWPSSRQWSGRPSAGERRHADPIHRNGVSHRGATNGTVVKNIPFTNSVLRERVVPREVAVRLRGIHLALDPLTVT